MNNKRIVILTILALLLVSAISIAMPPQSAHAQGPFVEGAAYGLSAYKCVSGLRGVVNVTTPAACAAMAGEWVKAIDAYVNPRGAGDMDDAAWGNNRYGGADGSW